MTRLRFLLAPEDPPAGGAPPATPPAPPATDPAASDAAAVLAKRSHEARAERAEGDAPVRMVDLHDVRAELRGELDALKRARTVPHAVPAAAAGPAQGRRGASLPVVLLAALVVGLLVLWRAAPRIFAPVARPRL